MAIGNNIAAATTSLLVIIISIGLIPLFLDYQVESTGKVGVVVPGTVVVVRRLILEVTVVYPYSKTVRLPEPSNFATVHGPVFQYKSTHTTMVLMDLLQYHTQSHKSAKNETASLITKL